MFSSPMLRRCSFLTLACLTVLVTAGGALGQDRFALEQFDAAPDRDGGILTVHGARTLDPGSYGVSVLGSYGRAPLSLKSGDSGKTLGELVGSEGTLQVMAGVGLARRFDISAVLPVHRMSAGSDFSVSPGPAVNAQLLTSSELGLGDLRLIPLDEPWAERRFIICFRDAQSLTPSAPLLMDYLANVHATLTELNHFADPEVSFIAHYGGPEGPKVEGTGLPFTATYLLPIFAMNQLIT